MDAGYSAPTHEQLIGERDQVHFFPGTFFLEFRRSAGALHPWHGASRVVERLLDDGALPPLPCQGAVASYMTSNMAAG